MLSGGTCWSLWERLCVWMTLTARVSRVPVIRLNPDRADAARRACASTYAIDIHKGKQKHARAQNMHEGGGLSRVQLPPVLSQLLVTWVTQLRAQSDTKMEKRKVGRWEEREIERVGLKEVGDIRLRSPLENNKKGDSIRG